MTTKAQKFLKIDLKPLKQKDILERINKYMSNSYVFCHIVSINPENVMIAQYDKEFRNILSQGDIQIVDGVGVALGGSILGIEVGDRMTGVDLMEIMLKNTKEGGLRVLLLGGKSNVADKLAKCYQEKFPGNLFLGLAGISDITSPKEEEEKAIFDIVADYKPQIIFAAFGSPWQEKWFWKHRDMLQGVICMGVGGGFDFASGEVARAPQWMRSIGAEWLFRLVTQPWRIKRQMRLISYLFLLLQTKIRFTDN